jgi:dTMP kinase
MTAPRAFIGRGLPYVNIEGLLGRLIVIEGSDAVGRTTQIRLLRDWLEVEGLAAIETGWNRSPLVKDTINLAKEGHTMNVLTLNLLYATDFADRLEHEIIPALRAGFIVLSDRYIYTAFARAIVRGADPQWIRSIFGFALQPDLVLYLKADTKTLFRRALLSKGLDYWESGRDQNPGLDPYDSFHRYQSKLLREFDRMAKEYGFIVINARRSVNAVQKTLRENIAASVPNLIAAPRIEPGVNESSRPNPDQQVLSTRAVD